MDLKMKKSGYSESIPTLLSTFLNPPLIFILSQAYHVLFLDRLTEIIQIVHGSYEGC
jgi:hypothetical protein